MLKTDSERENIATGNTFNQRSTFECEDKIEISSQGQGDTGVTNTIELEEMSTALETVETEDPRVKESWPFQQQPTSPGKVEKGLSYEDANDSEKLNADLKESIDDETYAEDNVGEEINTGASGGNADESSLNTRKGKTAKDFRPNQKPFSLKNLHLPEIHLPRKFHRNSGNTHGQLVEEPCSPVNTLEREQVQFKESLEHHSNIEHTRSVSDRAAESWRNFTSRARKQLHNLTTCSCVRSREQADISVKYRKETAIELPPDINAVTNENAEI